MLKIILIAMLGQWSNDATRVARACDGLMPGIVMPECYCGGACPRTGQTWDNVFWSMLISSECAPGAFSVYPDRQHRKSCTIHLSQEYTFGGQVEFPRPSYAYGVGRPQGAATSTLRFVGCGKTGVKVPGNSDVSYPGRHVGGGLALANIAIEYDNPSCTSTASHGLVTAGQVHLSGLHINGFPGDGWRVHAPKGGTAIDSTTFSVTISRTGQHGLNVMPGSNNNSIAFVDLNVNAACKNAPIGSLDSEGLPACSGIRFAGNLGADFYSPNVDMMNRDWPSFIISNHAASTGQVRIVGSYAEPNGVRSFAKYAAIFGNLAVQTTDRSLQIGARGIEGTAEFRNGEVVTKLGPTAGGSAFEAVSPLGTWNAYARPEGLCFVQGRVAPAAFCVSGAGSTSTLPQNRLRADQIYIGKSRPVYVGAGPRAARPLASSVPLGSTFVNTTAKPGEPSSWQTCDAPTRSWCVVGTIGSPD